jgi:hypothetical protein
MIHSATRRPAAILRSTPGLENEGNGLYFYRARYYDPELGRFVSEDPVQLMKKETIFVLLVMVLTCCSPLSSESYQAKLPDNKVVELTKSDLFALSGWKQREVSVVGFALGMTREEALENARLKGFQLRSDLLPRKVGEIRVPCRESSCSVVRYNGNEIGVRLYFVLDRIDKITVSVPADVDPEVKAANVTRHFKGRTHIFFNEYSDALRTKILGPAPRKEVPIIVSGQASNLSNVEYAYLQYGLIIHLTIDKNKEPSKPFDLEVDFVRPK